MAIPSLSARAIAENCLKLTGPVSIRGDLLIRRSEPPISLKAELKFTRQIHCGSPVHEGPHHVGRRHIKVERPNASRLEDVIVYYPATEDGEEVPFASNLEGPPFQLIGYAHGLRAGFPACPGAPTDPTGDYQQLSVVLGHLVRWGYVVISTDHSFAPFEFSMVDLLEASVAHMLAENGRSGSPFENRIRTDQIILMGHSTGGGAAIQVAASRAFDVLAIGLIAPGTNSRHLVPEVAAPLLVLLGTEDGGGAGTSDAKDIYDSARPPKHFVLIEGANHFGYTDALCIQDGDPQATIARVNQQRIAYGYLTAFLQRYVRDIRTYNAYLSGSLSIGGLGSFRISVDSES